MPLNQNKPHLSKNNGYWVCRCKQGNVGKSADFFRAYLNWMMTRVKT